MCEVRCPGRSRPRSRGYGSFAVHQRQVRCRVQSSRRRTARTTLVSSCFNIVWASSLRHELHHSDLDSLSPATSGPPPTACSASIFPRTISRLRVPCCRYDPEDVLSSVTRDSCSSLLLVDRMCCFRKATHHLDVLYYSFLTGKGRGNPSFGWRYDHDQ